MTVERIQVCAMCSSAFFNPFYLSPSSPPLSLSLSLSLHLSISLSLYLSISSPLSLFYISLSSPLSLSLSLSLSHSTSSPLSHSLSSSLPLSPSLSLFSLSPSSVLVEILACLASLLLASLSPSSSSSLLKFLLLFRFLLWALPLQLSFLTIYFKLFKSSYY